MDAIFVEVEQYDSDVMAKRLDNWILWCIDIEPHRLGFANKTSFARLIKPNADVRRQPKIIADANDALIIEKGVIRLPEYERALLTTQFKLKHLRLEVRLNSLACRGYGVHKSQYYNIIGRAKIMLKNILTRLE